MLLTLAVVLALGAPPSQGVTFRVLKPTASKASTAEVEATFRAVKKELEGQGYAIVTTVDEKASGTVSGTLDKRAEGLLLKLSITREKDQLILEEVSEAAKAPAELEQISVSAAKQLATAWRMANGVRVRIK